MPFFILILDKINVVSGPMDVEISSVHHKNTTITRTIIILRNLGKKTGQRFLKSNRKTWNVETTQKWINPTEKRAGNIKS